MITHLTDGELRTYLDGEMPARTQRQAANHLAACPSCRERAEALAAQRQRVQEHLALLSPLPNESPAPAGVAYIRMKNYLLEKEKPSMVRKIFAPRYRFAWVAIAVVVLLAVALAFPDVRALANNFLGLFRVQQFTIVQFNANDMPERLGASQQFEHLLSEDVQIEELGEWREVSTAEAASALAGFPVRLPTEIEGDLHLEVQPAVRATFTVDLPRVRALLTEIGRQDIVLPDELDGATATLELPTAVIATYGDCEMNVQEEVTPDPDSTPRAPKLCTTLVQLPSPTITAPPELDLASIGEAFLQLLGMTPEEAARFSQRIDWTTTLVVPIPRYAATYQDVRVDGVEGVLIRQSGEYDEISARYWLMWIKDGMVYSLTGQGMRSTALAIGNSLK